MRVAMPSPATASVQRLIEATETIDAIRLVVMCATIPPHLHSLACVAAQMPTWWQTSHTMTLLKGVCKHGWREWEKIIYDSSLEWDVPPNYKDLLKMSEAQHLPVVYGRAYYNSQVVNSSRSLVPEADYVAYDIEKDLKHVSIFNKPMSFLLQNLSTEQLETVGRVTSQYYVETLLSWCAPLPPPLSILRDHGLNEIMAPPSPTEIVYFYIKHERFPKHADRRKLQSTNR